MMMEQEKRKTKMGKKKVTRTEGALQEKKRPLWVRKKCVEYRAQIQSQVFAEMRSYRDLEQKHQDEWKQKETGTGRHTNKKERKNFPFGKGRSLRLKTKEKFGKLKRADKQTKTKLRTHILQKEMRTYGIVWTEGMMWIQDEHSEKGRDESGFGTTAHVTDRADAWDLTQKWSVFWRAKQKSKESIGFCVSLSPRFPSDKCRQGTFKSKRGIHFDRLDTWLANRKDKIGIWCDSREKKWRTLDQSAINNEW